MGLLHSAMELLSNTSSTSITVNSTLSSDSIYQMPMEANNLTQEAVSNVREPLISSSDVDASSGGAIDGSGDGVHTEQLEQNDVLGYVVPRLELKLPILSSSSTESESEERQANPVAGTSADNPNERSASPPPNCAICLGRCKNKCFTDSCMHQFCFKCLCEWSKVKPECPLCKQTFKSIIHNVKSIDQFEEYHVQPPIVQIAHNQFDFPQMRMIVHQDLILNDGWNERGRQRFFLTPNHSVGSSSGSIMASVGGGTNNRGGMRNMNDYNGEFLEMYRQEHPGNITSSDTLSQLWRRFVYDRKLYALPVCDVNGRFRDSTAQFYRDNPAQIHRLAPWISRDIICLLRQTQHDITTVIESIHSGLVIMNILSPAFRRRLTPYLGNKTSHFIHELNNFARSPHDMFGYDSVVQYSPQSNEEFVIEFTSSDDSTDNEIDVANDSTMGMSSASTNAINLTIHNRLASNSTRSGEVASGVVGNSTTRHGSQDDVNFVIDLRGDTDEQSAVATANTSVNDDAPMQSVAQVSENIELTSGSSDECEFVLERKPPHLRTPEMVSLDSASDSDVVFVDESKPLSKATFSTSEGEPDDTVDAERSKRPTTRSKITALVEAKKRNQQMANIMKNDNQGSSELYNVGASTSAALRLSIQRRGHGTRTRRNVYCLRNNRADRLQPARSDKHMGSESSHSTSSKGSVDYSLETNSSSSDEEFVASTVQKHNANSRKRPKAKRTRNGRCNNAGKRSATKRKKCNENESSCEEEDNGHLGKNFALVMAMGERLKRQKAKRRNYRPAGASDDDDDSFGEDLCRTQAIDESFRKQQQDKVKAKTKPKPAERKRKVRKATQKNKEQKSLTAEEREPAVNKNMVAHDNCESSSDESDNLKLIELKSKLNAKCNVDNLEACTSSNGLQQEHDRNNTGCQTQNASSACPKATLQSPTSPVPSLNSVQRQFFKMEEVDAQNSTDNEQNDDADLQDFNDEANQDMNQVHARQELDLGSGGEEYLDSNVGRFVEVEYTEEVDRDSINEYSNEATNMPSPTEEDVDDGQEDHQQDDEDSQIPLNMHTPLNLSNETHIFEGTSMSATTATTDTNLNDALEQVSSARCRFYDSLPTNTAEFADDNTSNSTSSDSSVSTTTTTSSSNSNSSNTNGYVNYNIS